MTNLIVAKFGGSAIGPDGETIPKIIQRISDLKIDSKVIAVFSAPINNVTMEKNDHLTDIILEQGRNAENGITPSFGYCKINIPKNSRDG